MTHLTEQIGTDYDADMVSGINKQKGRKNPHAVALGRRGGLARAKSLTKKQISEIGRKGARARWGKRGK